MTRTAIAAALLLCGSLGAAAQTAPQPAATAAPVPKPKRTAKPGREVPPPLDFSGVWVLDETASQGVGPTMKGAVLSVRQNGNHIWIEPIERKEPLLLAEEIVVDGRKYEKGLGPMRGRKGTLTADWGKERESLWLQVEASDEDGKTEGYQRAVWRLRDNATVWTRQTRTITKDEVKDTFLVFRKRPEAKKP